MLTFKAGDKFVITDKVEKGIGYRWGDIVTIKEARPSSSLNSTDGFVYYVEERATGLYAHELVRMMYPGMSDIADTTLIVQFKHKEIGQSKLSDIARHLSNASGLNVICFDNQVDLTLIKLDKE